MEESSSIRRMRRRRADALADRMWDGESLTLKDEVDS